MYNHYKCRCDACCKAEHAYYLKRADSYNRQRIGSKWSDDVPKTGRRMTQKRHNANRWREFADRPSEHPKPIAWREIFDRFDGKCAICGIDVDPDDIWIGDNGRRNYGRKYPTVDHIVPLRHGGADTFDNVQLTCKHCNSSKGAKIVG